MSHEQFTLEQKKMHDLRHYPVRPHVGVGGVILWNSSILLIKRKFNPSAGKWAIPGGHLKLGEKTPIGAIRECQEETGLDLQIIKLASVIDHIDKNSEGKIEYHYVLVDYFMKVIGNFTEQKPPIPKAQSDVEDAILVPFENLSQYNLTRTTKELLIQLNIMESNLDKV